MLFISYGFLIFLAVVLTLYYGLPKRFQWPLLLIASYVFYGASGIGNLSYILATTISTGLLACSIQDLSDVQSRWLKEEGKGASREERKAYKHRIKKKRWRRLLLCLAIDIGMLAVVKYTGFAVCNLNGLLKALGSGRQLPFFEIALPMGISFYVFQAVGYAIDVYRGKYRAQENLFQFALFVSFFPQLIQGPISRFDQLSVSLFAPHRFDTRTVSLGLQRVLWGFFKKLVVADRLIGAVGILTKDAQTYQGCWVLVGMLLYGVELYADFTGGIDITIGIAQAMGITVQENFIRPYFSKSVKEYWNRWHISMGSWFTDYIFYPVSVCKPMLDLSSFSRKHLGERAGRRVPVYVSCLLVWAATGIWHGAGWNFLVWGLSNCVVLLISQELEPLYRRFHKRFPVAGTFGWRLVGVARTFFILCCLRTFDCYRDVPLTFRMLGSVVTSWNWGELFSPGRLLELGLTPADYGVVLLGILLMLGVSLWQRKGSVRGQIAKKPYGIRLAEWLLLFLMVLVWGSYGIGYEASQFIYNQF